MCWHATRWGAYMIMSLADLHYSFRQRSASCAWSFSCSRRRRRRHRCLLQQLSAAVSMSKWTAQHLLVFTPQPSDHHQDAHTRTHACTHTCKHAHTTHTHTSTTGALTPTVPSPAPSPLARGLRRCHEATGANQLLQLGPGMFVRRDPLWKRLQAALHQLLLRRQLAGGGAVALTRQHPLREQPATGGGACIFKRVRNGVLIQSTPAAPAARGG